MGKSTLRRRGAPQQQTAAQPAAETRPVGDKHPLKEMPPKILSETAGKAQGKEGKGKGRVLSPSRQPVAWLLSHVPYTREVLLFCMAMVVRFWRIGEPQGVVFDESHFGKFTAHYMRGSYVFDIHPPLGKMTFAFLGTLLGYDATKCDFNDIGTLYADDCEYTKLRGVSATFGSLLPALTYSIARKLGASKDGAFAAGFFVVFDMLNTTESRLVLMDAQLMFWSALSLWVGLKFFALFAPRDGSPSTLTQDQCNKWYVAIGVVCGLAISIKWTALVNPGMVAVEGFFGIWFLHRRRLPFVDLLKIAAVTIATYVTVFWFHFWALPKTGDRASAFVPAEFSDPYERTLLGHPDYDPNNQFSFVYKFLMLNFEMFLVNSKITQPHHWGSRFNQWVVNARGVAYWGGAAQPDGYVDHTLHRHVYLMGNPFVVWTCFAGIFAFIATGFIYLRYRSWAGWVPGPKFVFALKCASFCFVAWVLNLAPYVAVERSSFAYHYMPGLLHAEILTALLVDRIAGKTLRRFFLGLMMAVAFVSFLYWCPWVYALPLQKVGDVNRRWMKGWD